MKSTKVINNISAKLKSEIPKLKPGETRVFQMLNGVPNPEPDEKEKSKSPVLYGKVQVATSFRVYDPYQTESKDEKGNIVYDGGYVDVGLVEQWNGDQPVRFKMFIPGFGEYAQFQGKFQVMGGRIQDEELFEILWLSNQREGNPHRDVSTETLFKLLDVKADSKASVTKVDRLLEAIGIAKSMSVEDANAVLVAFNQPTYQDSDVLRAKILDFAKTNVEEFLTAAKNPDNKISLTLREAVESGLIIHDIVSGDVKMDKIILTNIRVSTINDFIPLFTQFIKSSANGKEVLENIKAKVESLKKPVK